MMQYLVYSADGNTIDPSGEDVENCQVVDFIEAETMAEARQKLVDSEIYTVWANLVLVEISQDEEVQ